MPSPLSLPRIMVPGGRNGRRGIRSAVGSATVFCIILSAAVFLLAKPLMMIFIDASEAEILSIGVTYLRIEGAFYLGIGFLSLLYGLYRAIALPVMSVVLTFISLGTRVLLAYTLSAIPSIGVVGIWWSVPIGWFLADVTGFLYYFLRQTEDRGKAEYGTICRLTGKKPVPNGTGFFGQKCGKEKFL